jgi:uncharacterized membrane protein
MHRWENVHPDELARPLDAARGCVWGLAVALAFWVPVVAGVYFGMIR